MDLPLSMRSSGKILLAGSCGRNNISLEDKCRRKKDNSGCLKGFDL